MNLSIYIYSTKACYIIPKKDKIIKLNTKNNINLILRIYNVLVYFSFIVFFSFSCFSSTILSCDKARVLINVSINFEINDIKFEKFEIINQIFLYPDKFYTLYHH